MVTAEVKEATVGPLVVQVEVRESMVGPLAVRTVVREAMVGMVGPLVVMREEDKSAGWQVNTVRKSRTRMARRLELQWVRRLVLSR